MRCRKREIAIFLQSILFLCKEIQDFDIASVKAIETSEEICDSSD